MNFSLIFPNTESSALSVAMLFIPCAAWVEGRTILAVPNRKTPHYQLGYFRALIELPSIASRLPETHRQLTLIVHPIGHGSSEDLAKLLQDCADEGFDAQIINMPPTRLTSEQFRT